MFYGRAAHSEAIGSRRDHWISWVTVWEHWLLYTFSFTFYSWYQYSMSWDTCLSMCSRVNRDGVVLSSMHLPIERKYVGKMHMIRISRESQKVQLCDRTSLLDNIMKLSEPGDKQIWKVTNRNDMLSQKILEFRRACDTNKTTKVWNSHGLHSEKITSLLEKIESEVTNTIQICLPVQIMIKKTKH